MDNTLSKPRIGDLRIQKKIILNKNNPERLEVAIGEIEVVESRFGKQLHYILSFGGDKTIRIIGKKNWNAFLDMVKWLEWDPNDTQEIYIPQLDNFSEAETYENTMPDIEVVDVFTDTLEYEIEDFEKEIIDGIPLYDD